MSIEHLYKTAEILTDVKNYTHIKNLLTLAYNSGVQATIDNLTNTGHISEDIAVIAAKNTKKEV